MIVFKYKNEPSGREDKIIKRPVADVFLKTSQEEWIKFHPYIDSGADITLIPFSLGKLAGFNLDEDKVEEIGGIRGSMPVIYLSGELKIGTVELEAQLVWALLEEVPPLLGRADVFDYFHVTFKQDVGRIIFEEKANH